MESKFYNKIYIFRQENLRPILIFHKNSVIGEKGLKVSVTGCSLTLKGHFLERNKMWRIILRVL